MSSAKPEKLTEANAARDLVSDARLKSTGKFVDRKSATGKFVSRNKSKAARKQASSESAMQRTHVLMPGTMIEEANDMADDEGVSFSEIVRRAIAAYKSGSKTDDADNEMLETLLDQLNSSLTDTANSLKKLNKRLEERY